MIKKSIIIFFLLTSFVQAVEIKKSINGETNFSQSKQKSLITTLNNEYKLTVYEERSKKYIIYFAGKISIDYDHFGKEIKTNAFTTFGIDF
jgi:hypothetical protein